MVQIVQINNIITSILAYFFLMPIICIAHSNQNSNDFPLVTVFMAYKEVLDLYDHGLDLQEDIIMVWPCNDYGYIKRLPSPLEQQRPGGSGVYYHLSYLGRPHDSGLWKAFATALPHDQAMDMKEEVAFFQAVKARLVKFDADGSAAES
jgi:hypothetical protein